MTILENTKTRISKLDGIRGCAILLVLIWHYFGNQFQTNPKTLLSYLGQFIGLFWSGVDLFFVLSGFLITSILLENRESTNLFKVFYIRRFCRIFPLYFLFTGMTILLVWFGGGSINYLGLLHDNSVPLVVLCDFHTKYIYGN